MKRVSFLCSVGISQHVPQMTAFKATSLSMRLVFGMAAMIVLLLFIAGLEYVEFSNVRTATASITDDVFPAYRYASAAALNGLQIRAAHTHFSATGDSRDLEVAKKAAQDFSTNSDSFLKANVDQQLSGLWEAVLIPEGALEDDTKAFAVPAKRAATEKKSVADYQQLADALSAVRKNQQIRIEAVTARAVMTARFASSSALILAVVGLIVGILIAAVTIRSVTTPIERVADRLRQMSDGQSDLRARIEIRSNDSLGRLARGFNDFVENLSHIVRDTRRSAESLVRTSGRLVNAYSIVDDGLQSGAEELRRAKRASETIEHIAENVSQNEVRLAEAIDSASISITESASSMRSLSRTVASVAADVDAVVAAFSEMDVTIGQVALAVEECSVSAQRAADQGKIGSTSVDELLVASRETTETLQHVAESISRLDRQSQEIGGIVGAIEDIADQTNLLALNAAIEAARAGDAGRGFAVVADEVRKLAEKSASSTREISKLVNDVRKNIDETVKSATSGAAKSNASLIIADNAGRAIASAGTAITHASEQLMTISRASREQAESSRALSESAVRMSSGAAEAASSLESQNEIAARMVQSLESIGRVRTALHSAVLDQQKAAAEVGAAIQRISSVSDTTTLAASDVRAASDELEIHASGLSTLVDGFQTHDAPEPGSLAILSPSKP